LGYVGELVTQEPTSLEVAGRQLAAVEDDVSTDRVRACLKRFRRPGCAASVVQTSVA
jgi:hypothetical protein